MCLTSCFSRTEAEYVALISNHKMSASLREQVTTHILNNSNKQIKMHSLLFYFVRKIDAFLEGFYKLLPPELVSIFDAQQLELLICGLPEIDIDDLRCHTIYQGYKQSDSQILYLWNVVRTFSKEEKALFLQFVTGTSKVPLEGFRALQGNGGVKHFNIHKAYNKGLLPTAHTCFNQLDLPEYDSENELRTKLLIAIKEGSEGFAFA